MDEDKCFSSARLSPSSAKAASSYCTSFIKFTPVVTKTATATTVTTVVSTAVVNATPASVTTTQTNTITPAPVTVSSTCATTTSTVAGTFTTSIDYVSRSSAPGGNMNKRAQTTALTAQISANCGSGKSFTSAMNSACSCLLGTTKTTTTTSTKTATSTVTKTVTNTLVPQTQTTVQTITLPASTATDCQTATATTTTYPGGAGLTCGVPVSVYTTGGSITCASAASPSQTNARFRIEGGSSEGTIFDGPCIAAGPETITTPSGGSHLCDGTNGGANPAPGGTLTTAIDAAGDQNGFGFDGTYTNSFQDFFIQTIGNTAQTNNQYWGVLRQLTFTSRGGCQEYNSPGEGLWAFDAFNANAFLALSSEYAVVAPGQSVTLQVLQTDGNGAALSPAAGASFAEQTTDANGNVAFTAPTTPGCYQYKATRNGSIRSSAFYLTVANLYDPTFAFSSSNRLRAKAQALRPRTETNFRVGVRGRGSPARMYILRFLTSVLCIFSPAKTSFRSDPPRCLLTLSSWSTSSRSVGRSLSHAFQEHGFQHTWP
nr:hypothetical protein CFP56_04012 [Quercus suber]